MQTLSDASGDSSKPWYREPWPWILMAGPAAAVLGCAVTIYLAVTRFADEPIAEGATRQGLVVKRAPGAAGAVMPGADDRAAAPGRVDQTMAPPAAGAAPSSR
jgi:hypothetical protein